MINNLRVFSSDGTGNGKLPHTSDGQLQGHECFGDGIWRVTGLQKEGTTGYEDYTPGLVKYEFKTGLVVQVVEFVPGSSDIHDVAVYNGQLYGV